jgi:hypothetical protein
MEEVSEDWAAKIAALPSEVLTTSATSQSISPNVKVELAWFVPCGVTYHKITRNCKIVGQQKIP